MDRAEGTPFRPSRGDQALSRANVAAVASAGFVLGAFFGSSVASTGLSAAAAAAAAAGFISRSRRAAATLAAGIAVLAGYWYAAGYQHLRTPMVRPAAGGFVEGVVVSDPVIRERSQRFRVALREPSSGRIEISAFRFPEAAYGDRIRLSAAGLHGERGGEIEIAGRGEASRARAYLIRLKHAALARFRECLPTDHAALLGGLLLGDRGGFSAGFRDAMSRSGTTHLVALSGYNIGLVISGAGLMLRRLLPRRVMFFAMVGTVVAFVAMVGGEPSVVRAAVMGILLLMALSAGRSYAVWRAMALAAFLMTLHDPSVARFDLGFQLSFLSLAGVVLLGPVVSRAIGADKKTRSFLDLRGHLAMTIAAQAMVLPLLVATFGSVSLVSFAANTLVLPAVPLIMLIGFIAAFLGLVVPALGAAVLWSAYGFLAYMIGTIRFFASFAGAWDVSFSGPWFVILYYAAVGLAAIAFRKKK